MTIDFCELICCSPFVASFGFSIASCTYNAASTRSFLELTLLFFRFVVRLYLSNDGKLGERFIAPPYLTLPSDKGQRSIVRLKREALVGRHMPVEGGFTDYFPGVLASRACEPSVSGNKGAQRSKHDLESRSPLRSVPQSPAPLTLRRFIWPPLTAPFPLTKCWACSARFPLRSRYPYSPLLSCNICTPKYVRLYVFILITLICNY
jgi:hypothetical protein